jgi:hypothetical protein
VSVGVDFDFPQLIAKEVNIARNSMRFGLMDNMAFSPSQNCSTF